MATGKSDWKSPKKGNVPERTRVSKLRQRFETPKFQPHGQRSRPTRERVQQIRKQFEPQEEDQSAQSHHDKKDQAAQPHHAEEEYVDIIKEIAENHKGDIESLQGEIQGLFEFLDDISSDKISISPGSSGRASSGRGSCKLSHVRKGTYIDPVKQLQYSSTSGRGTYTAQADTQGSSTYESEDTDSNSENSGLVYDSVDQRWYFVEPKLNEEPLEDDVFYEGVDPEAYWRDTPLAKRKYDWFMDKGPKIPLYKQEGADAAEPTGKGTYTAGPSGKGTYTAGPSGKGTYTAKPSGKGTYTTKPFGRGTYTAKPSGRGTYTAEPSGRGTYTAEPSGKGTYTTKPSGKGTYTADPSARGTYTAEPSGRGTYTAEPSGRGTHTAEPSARGTYTAQAGTQGSSYESEDPESLENYGEVYDSVDQRWYFVEPKLNEESLEDDVFYEGVDPEAYWRDTPLAKRKYDWFMDKGPKIPLYKQEGADSVEPSGKGTYTVQPTGKGTYTAKPSGKGTYTAKPSGKDTYTTKPFGRGTYTAKPSGRGTYTAEPSGRGTYTAEPSGKGTYTTKPSGKGTYTAKPSGKGTYTAKPPGRGTYTEKSSGKGTYTTKEDTAKLGQHTPSISKASRHGYTSKRPTKYLNVPPGDDIRESERKRFRGPYEGIEMEEPLQNYKQYFHAIFGESPQETKPESKKTYQYGTPPLTPSRQRPSSMSTPKSVFSKRHYGIKNLFDAEPETPKYHSSNDSTIESEQSQDSPQNRTFEKSPQASQMNRTFEKSPQTSQMNRTFEMSPQNAQMNRTFEKSPQTSQMNRTFSPDHSPIQGGAYSETEDLSDEEHEEMFPTPFQSSPKSFGNRTFQDSPQWKNKQDSSSHRPDRTFQESPQNQYKQGSPSPHNRTFEGSSQWQNRQGSFNRHDRTFQESPQNQYKQESSSNRQDRTFQESPQNRYKQGSSSNRHDRTFQETPQNQYKQGSPEHDEAFIETPSKYRHGSSSPQHDRTFEDSPQWQNRQGSPSPRHDRTFEDSPQWQNRQGSSSSRHDQTF